MRAYGSSKDIADQVAKMDAEDKAKGVSPDQYRSIAWGLKPSAAKTYKATYPDGTTAMLNAAEYFSVANLKKMEPDENLEYLENFSKSMIDDYGNLRSDIYRKLYEGKRDLKIDTGLGTDQSKQEYQKSMVEAKRLQEEQKAYAPFTPADTFGSSFVPGEKPRTSSVPAVNLPSPTVNKPMDFRNPNDLAKMNSSAPSGFEIDPVTGYLKLKTPK